MFQLDSWAFTRTRPLVLSSKHNLLEPVEKVPQKILYEFECATLFLHLKIMRRHIRITTFSLSNTVLQRCYCWVALKQEMRAWIHPKWNVSVILCFTRSFSSCLITIWSLIDCCFAAVSSFFVSFVHCFVGHCNDVGQQHTRYLKTCSDSHYVLVWN